MSWLNLVSVLCLCITGGLAALAVFSHHFDDNLAQRVGLSIVALGSAARIVERLTTEVPDAPPPILWSHIGLTLFAVGTAWKMYRASRKAGPERRSPRARRGEMLG